MPWHICYLEYFICLHHLRRHHLISNHHGPFFIVTSIVIASCLSQMSLSVGILIVRFINLDPHARMFTNTFFDLPSHTNLGLHCLPLCIVFLLCKVWLVITFGLELACRMCVVTTTSFFVHTISHAVTAANHARLYCSLEIGGSKRKTNCLSLWKQQR